MRILVLGASGMLGHAVYRVLAEDPQHEVFGSVRAPQGARNFPGALAERIIPGCDVENLALMADMFAKIRPEAVVNCVGLVKQLPGAKDPLAAITLNALLPHRLAGFCEKARARLVHISTDCVFSGRKGGYTEAEEPDPTDLYGRSKLLGEVDYPHAVTLRTSMIGEQLDGGVGLVSWFLGQREKVRGFTQAFFSGLPTSELAGIIRDRVLPRPGLHGLFHVASEPISKYDLLHLINKEYKKNLPIQPDGSLQINRTLDASRFRDATGYTAPPWPDLVARMRRFHQK